MEFMPDEYCTPTVSETPTANLDTVACTVFFHPLLFVLISNDTRLQKLATSPLNLGAL